MKTALKYGRRFLYLNSSDWKLVISKASDLYFLMRKYIFYKQEIKISSRGNFVIPSHGLKLEVPIFQEHHLLSLR